LLFLCLAGLIVVVVVLAATYATRIVNSFVDEPYNVILASDCTMCLSVTGAPSS